MGLKERRQTLKDLFKAVVPLIYVQTADYQDAQKDIVEAAKAAIPKNADLDLAVWKITQGMAFGTVHTGVGEPDRELADLLDALAKIEVQAQKDQPLLAIFHNIRQFIDNPGVIQQIIDSALIAKLHGSYIVFLGPELNLPCEIQNMVTVVPYPLPDQAQIAKLFRTIVSDYSAAVDLDGVPWDKASKKDQKEAIDTAARAAMGLDMFGAETSIALSISRSGTVNPRLIMEHKKTEIAKSDILEFVNTDEDMDNIGGFGALKDWLKRRERAFSQDAINYGLRFPRGILIAGVPGTGKSLCAKAVGHYLGLLTVKLDMARAHRKWQGESEAAFRYALKQVEAAAPVLLWLEEIEKALAGMESSGETDSGTSARIGMTLLTWQAENVKPVMIVATANNVFKLPPEVTRKGRFDEVWTTDLPAITEREEIFKIHLRKRNRDFNNFDIALLARRTDGFVGSEIEAVIEDGMYLSFFQDRELETRDIMQAIGDTRPQSQRDSVALERYRSWAEGKARPVSNWKETKQSNGTDKVRKIRLKGINNGEDDE